MPSKPIAKRLQIIFFAFGLSITWLIIVLGVPIWRFNTSARAIRSDNADALRVVMEADYSLLEAGCRELLAKRGELPCTMHSLAYAELHRRTSSAPVEHLIVTNVPAAILALMPAVIEIDTNSVYIRIRPRSRDGLMYSEDGSLGYGNMHLTNGLWYFHDGQSDSQNTIQSAPKR